MNSGQSNKESRRPRVFYGVIILLLTTTLGGMTYMYWGMSARYEKVRQESIWMRNELSDLDSKRPRCRKA